MAKKVTVTLVDDFDGAGSADETVEFGLDGVTYEIDLSSKNATKLRNDLKQWVAAGRRVGGRRRKLTERQCAEIAEGVLTGRKTAAEMARLFGVSQPTVSRIVAAARAAA